MMMVVVVVVVVVVVGDGSVVHLLPPLLTRTFASSSSCPSLNIEFFLFIGQHAVVTVVCRYLSYYYCPIKITPLSGKNDPNSTYRRVRMKLAEFSTLSFTNSFVVKYFCKIADVAGWHGASITQQTHNSSLRHFFLSRHTPAPEI